MESLTVYLNDRQVARLTDDNGGKRRYVCERYDRMGDGGAIRRLHQEDFCQLLRVDPKRKYEVLGMLRRIEKQAPVVAAKLSVRFPSDCYARIIDGVLARSRQLATS